MHIVALASQKGGSGKTTLAGHIAVQAERMGAGPVAVFDTDPQENLTEWWDARAADTPTLARTSLHRLLADVQRLRGLGIKLLVIDTPPAITSIIREVIKISDLAVIPARPSPHDLRSVGKTLKLVDGLEKPLVFVVNCASSRARITSQAVIALSQHGTVAPAIIHQRVDFAYSMIDGRTVMEVRRNSHSAAEIALLWEYLNNRLNKKFHQTLLPSMRNVA